MSDLNYFQSLLADAKDPMMIAFYQSAVRERNGGYLGDCVHTSSAFRSERSHNTTYSWCECLDCGTNFNYGHHKRGNRSSDYLED